MTVAQFYNIGPPDMKKYAASVKIMGLISSTLVLQACAIMPATGPSGRGIARAEAGREVGGAEITVVDVTDAVTRQMLTIDRRRLFSEELGEGAPVGAVVGNGDVLDVAIWEAPPAALFGTSGDTKLGAGGRATSLPEQMVDSDGQITVPFVGQVRAAGRTPQAIAREISSRLMGKAHQPQAVVRLVRNAAANVTVVGDVAGSARVPLTARGERVLDVLASAGGVKQPVGKMTIQITRGMKVVSLPLESVIRDPSQNVRLQPDDVMTVLFQPFSFTALGAIGKNDEVPFEGTGLTLAQALGRISGLQDTRADVKGVFIFRLEESNALEPTARNSVKTTPDGKIPVIYRINMKDPATFFVAQSFPIRNRDLLYVSNAPLADIQKFVNVIYSTVLPVATTATAM